jgi:steroid delta-isomerase-like uncharacterized protein
MGCSFTTAIPDPEGPGRKEAAMPVPTRQQMDQVIDDHYAFEGADDVEGVLATLSDDVDHDVVGSPAGPIRGKADARRFYERMFADLEQQGVSTLRRYYGGDFVVDESLWKGTAVGDPLGLPGRNRPVQFRILHVFEFDDEGAIRRENVWMDLAALAAQLPDVTATSASDGTGSTARDVVLAFYDDFDRGGLADSTTMAVEFEATVFGSTTLDRPGFVEFGQSFVDAFSDGRHVFDFVVAEGDTVATIGHYRGCHDGELMGVAPTGREVDFTVMHVDRVVDGRIVEHRGMGDIDAMWTQLGIDPRA